MQVDANEVIRELSERLAKQEVELATLRALLRQQAAEHAAELAAAAKNDNQKEPVA